MIHNSAEKTTTATTLFSIKKKKKKRINESMKYIFHDEMDKYYIDEQNIVLHTHNQKHYDQIEMNIAARSNLFVTHKNNCC